VPYLHGPHYQWDAAKLKVEENTGNFNLTKAVVSHEPHYANNPYAVAFNPTMMIDRRNAPPAVKK